MLYKKQKAWWVQNISGGISLREVFIMALLKRYLLLFAGALFLFAGCGSGGGEEVVLKSLTLAKSEETIIAGAAFELQTTGTAVYSDGKTKTVSLTWAENATQYLEVGEHGFMASYSEDDITVTANFKLIVVANQPETLVLYQNSGTVLQNRDYDFPKTGKVTYSDKKEADVELTWAADADCSTAGSKIYQCTYTESGKTVTADFNLTVTADSSPVMKMKKTAESTVGSEIDVIVELTGITEKVTGTEIRFGFDSQSFEYVSASFLGSWSECMSITKIDDVNSGILIASTARAAADASYLSGDILKIKLKSKKAGKSEVYILKGEVLDSSTKNYISGIDYSDRDELSVK